MEEMIDEFASRNETRKNLLLFNEYLRCLVPLIGMSNDASSRNLTIGVSA